MNDCFYCQGLNCDFCGVFNNPLYSVIYENKEKLFCCGCAWWRYSWSEEEKGVKKMWFQRSKKTLSKEFTAKAKKSLNNKVKTINGN